MRSHCTGRIHSSSCCSRSRSEDILSEWLERRGEGPSPGLREALARRDDRADGGGGLRVHPARLRLRADGSGGFAYFDTERELGYLVEAVEQATS
jgi:hypothetical protein